MQLRILAAVLLVGSVASAQPAPEASVLAAPLPGVGSWALDLRMPLDVAHGGDITAVSVIGVGLDLDNRVTEHGYLGLSGEASMVMAIDSKAMPPTTVEPQLRLRGGVDARYVFHEGISEVVPHCGPAFDVPSQAWIGGRAGVETLDEGDSLGKFAEVSIGWERHLGRVLIGPYLAVGLEDEPASAYGSTAMPLPGTIAAATPDPSDPVTSTYVALGLRIGGD